MDCDISLTPQQQAEAQSLYEQLRQTFLDEARRFARLMASKPDSGEGDGCSLREPGRLCRECSRGAVPRWQCGQW